MAGGKAATGRGKGRLLTEGESCDEGTCLSTGDTFITIWQNESPQALSVDAGKKTSGLNCQVSVITTHLQRVLLEGRSGHLPTETGPSWRQCLRESCEILFSLSFSSGLPATLRGLEAGSRGSPDWTSAGRRRQVSNV